MDEGSRAAVTQDGEGEEMRPVLFLQLHRPNRHLDPQPAKYILNVFGYAVLGLLLYVIVVMVML